MTVNPAFHHQHCLRSPLPEVRRMRETIERGKPGCELESDGSVNLETTPLVVAVDAMFWRPARLFSVTTRESP